MGRILEKAAALCVVRDARDIIPFICGHYLRSCFGHVRFIDDGSSDGTFEFLQRLSARTQRVSVERVIYDTFRQPELMTAGANSLIAQRYRLIVPFDSDEFWNINARNLEHLLREHGNFVFFGQWVNFVQRSDVTLPRPLGLLRMKFRAPALSDVNRERVTGFQKPFVCWSERKVAFKTAGQITINRGQHLPGTNGNAEFEIFHLPLRTRSEIIKRGMNYELRRASARSAPSESWQSAFHREVVLRDSVDEVWKANSVNDERALNAFGETIPVSFDTRLRNLLLRVSTFMLLNFGIIVA
jgi:hypothetical protein